MIYSKTCEYAIRSLSYFALHPETESASVREVSKGTGVPHAYVAKIFQCLVKSGILRSRRGPAGGFSLLVPPSKLSLIRVIQVIDDPATSPLTQCVMGLHDCNDKVPCPMHLIWSLAKEKMLHELLHSTIADVAGLTNEFTEGKTRRRKLSKKMRAVFSL